MSSGFSRKREVETNTVRCEAARRRRRSFSLPRAQCIATASPNYSTVVTCRPNEREQHNPLRGFSKASSGKQGMPRSSHTSRSPLTVRCFRYWNFAVRKGFALTYGLKESPKPKELTEFG